jgi:hypothetical protein
MSRFPECVQALVNAGAFEALLQINKTFGADVDLAKECLEVMGRLAITKENMLVNTHTHTHSLSHFHFYSL